MTPSAADPLARQPRSRESAGAATIASMKTLDQRALEALGALPDEMRERAVEFLEDQAEKLRVLRAMIAEGEADVAAGRVSDWNLEEFLKEAGSHTPSE